MTVTIASAFGRHDQVDRVDRHHAQAVELLGGDHGPDLGGGRGAGPSRGEQGREHRPELADEAQADDGAERLLGAEAHERVVALEAEHHADGQTAHADDDERQHAELEHLVEVAASPPRRRHGREADAPAEPREATEVGDEAHHRPAQVTDRGEHHAPPAAARVPSTLSSRKLVTRGSGCRLSASTVPSTGPCGSSRTTWSASRIVDGM